MADTKETTDVEAAFRSALDKLDSLLPAPTGSVSVNPFWVPGEEVAPVKDGEGPKVDGQVGGRPPTNPPQNSGPSTRSGT
jgi:hypothetical protein